MTDEVDAIARIQFVYFPGASRHAAISSDLRQRGIAPADQRCDG